MHDRTAKKIALPVAASILFISLSACSGTGSSTQAADLEACHASGRLALKLSDQSLSDTDLVPLAQEVVDAASNGASSEIRGLADDMLAGIREGADTQYFGNYTAAMIDMNSACKPVLEADRAG